MRSEEWQPCELAGASDARARPRTEEWQRASAIGALPKKCVHTLSYTPTTNTAKWAANRRYFSQGPRWDWEGFLARVRRAAGLL